MPVTQTTDEIYPSRWLKAEQIPNDGDLIVTIADVNAEALGTDKELKLVCVFRETDKQLALNVTNARTLEQLYGKDPNEWIGKRIALFATEVQFAGKMTLAVRVRMRPPAQPQPQQPPRDPEQVVTELGYAAEY